MKINCHDPADRQRLRMHFEKDGIVLCAPDGKHGGDPEFLCGCTILPKMGTVDAVARTLVYECGCSFAYHLQCAPRQIKARAAEAAFASKGGSY